MKCYSCNAEIVAHPNYPQVKVWLDKDSEPPRPHKCPPKEKIIQYGKWRGFTYKEAADISSNQERIHREYLAKLREKFRSPWIKD
jgi:hypothetical protein